MTATAYPIAPRRIDIALLLIRLAVGVIMVAHGYQKVFTYGLAGVSGGFAQMGIPMANIVGPLVALVELLGGIALIIGLLTRLAALGLAIDMLGAILLVHFKNGFFLPQGYEFVLALFTMAVALAFMGAGEFSLDGLIGRRKGLTPAMAFPARSRDDARKRNAA